MGPKRDGLRVRGGQEPHLRLVQTESSFEDPAAVTAEGPARLRTYDDGWSWPGHEGNDRTRWMTCSTRSSWVSGA